MKLWDHRFPVPDPSPYLPNYHDEVTHCLHFGPYSGSLIRCQAGCGRSVCCYCRYESTKRYVCTVCYYRIDAWRSLEALEVKHG